MREIRTEIDIAAPKDKVWDILTDFENWHGWNPAVKKVVGKAGLNESLTITMRGKTEGSEHSYQPIFQEFRPNEYFRFRAYMKAKILFTNDKICELQETDTGVKLIHIEQFRGLMVMMMWGKMEKGVTMMLNMINKALKKKAEG